MAFELYAFASAALIAIGLHGVLTHREILRLVLSLNVMGGGVFLLLIAVAYRNRESAPDPVPQALILTGIVVAVSITAVAVALARRLHRISGRTTLPEEDLE